MIPALAEVERNTRNVAVKTSKFALEQFSEGEESEGCLNP